MAVVEAWDNLSEYLPDHILLNVLLSEQAALDHLLEVSTFAVLHYYVNFQVALIYASFVEAHNVWVLQVSQDINLGYNLLLFFVVHFAVV